jgi:hypothetical protein
VPERGSPVTTVIKLGAAVMKSFLGRVSVGLHGWNLSLP